jgi:hypothetical protein
MKLMIRANISFGDGMFYSSVVVPLHSVEWWGDINKEVEELEQL